MGSLQPLFSGSSGNAVLVRSKDYALLVDAGVSGKRILEALSLYHQTGSTLSGILVTHEHVDHIRSVGMMARKFHLPVYASEGTWQAMAPMIGDVSPALVREFSPETGFDVGDIHVTPFSIPHDAAQPVGFTFETNKKKTALCTDVGAMNEKIFLRLGGSEEVLIESNYDIVMLQKGPYPYHLKKRILGENGHLSNKEAATVCARLACLGTKKIILGHLSHENNTPQLAFEAARLYIENCGMEVGRDIKLSVANRA